MLGSTRTTVPVGWPLRVGCCGLVDVGRSLCRLVGCYRSVAVGRLLCCLVGGCWVGHCGSVAVGRSLWVGRSEPVAIGWSLYTRRRMRIAYSGLLLRSHVPPGLRLLDCGRGGRVGCVGRVERVALDIFLLLRHNDSSAPV